MVAGRYRLISALGNGGMGTVWLAEDDILSRQVAVKAKWGLWVTAAERDECRHHGLFRIAFYVNGLKSGLASGTAEPWSPRTMTISTSRPLPLASMAVLRVLSW